MDKKLTLVTLFATFALFSEGAFANFYTVYRYPVAAAGSCIKPHDSSPREILRRNGIGYHGNPSQSEIAALAKGVGQVERLLGDPLPHPWRQNYKFIDASGKWNQGPTTINIRRPRGSAKGTNVGRMMHELGHKVGNSGVYQSYAKFTGRTRCRITGYAASKFNEEFAEVFEAYVVYPDLLAQKCPKAFEFMATRLFPNTNDEISTCKKVADNEGPQLPQEIPIPIPRPDFEHDHDHGEVETDEDVVIEVDGEETDEDENHVEEASGSNVQLPVRNIPVPTARPSSGVR
ncbi:hypothetical protein [Bdellovibrio bacteriovorus]|uniref:hypothetical protein n=1 Tax=Bdellovibrio bacteriovorus TaxID=959 RepID=UPI0035A65F99